MKKGLPLYNNEYYIISNHVDSEIDIGGDTLPSSSYTTLPSSSSSHAVRHIGKLRRAMHDVITLFFPETCCCCGQSLVGEKESLCVDCRLHLAISDYAERKNNPAEMRLAGRIPFVAASSFLLFTHNSITQSILHSIKYRHGTHLAKVMGQLMGKNLAESGRFDDIDLIIPVPLHPAKQRRRGYNQSALICLGIAETFPHPIVNNCLLRTVNTATQTHMNRQQRLDNMQDVFSLRRPEALQDKHILLVDDVLTTGATLEACWIALQQVKGVHVSFATLAIAGEY